MILLASGYVYYRFLSVFEPPPCLRLQVVEHTGGVYSSSYPVTNMLNASASKAYSSKNGKNKNLSFIFAVAEGTSVIANQLSYYGPGNGYTAPAVRSFLSDILVFL